MADSFHHATFSPETPAPNVVKPARGRKRRWKRYVLFALVLLPAGGEIGLRIYAARNSNFNIRMGAGLEWDPLRTVRLRRSCSIGPVRTNSKGLLGPEFETRKTPDSIRLVTLGDSCSFIPAERNYPRVLEEQLRQAIPGTRLEVINASCPGYHSDQARLWYEREIDGYEHDLLIIYLGWNDMGQFNPDAGGYELQRHRPVTEPSVLHRLLMHCYLLRSVQVLETYRKQGRPVALAPLNIAEAATYYGRSYPTHFEQNLTSIIDLAKSRGRRVFLLNYATLVTASPTVEELKRMHFPVGMGRHLHKFLALIAAYETALERVSRKTGVPIIDITALFRNTQDRRVFTDSTHFNALGAERIAARVAEAVLPSVEQSFQTRGVE